jgi:hypothetical protein
MLRYLLAVSPPDCFVPRNAGDAVAVGNGIRRLPMFCEERNDVATQAYALSWIATPDGYQ